MKTDGCPHCGLNLRRINELISRALRAEAEAKQTLETELQRRQFWARSHAQIRRNVFRDMACAFFQSARACRMSRDHEAALWFESAAYIAQAASYS